MAIRGVLTTIALCVFSAPFTVGYTPCAGCPYNPPTSSSIPPIRTCLDSCPTPATTFTSTTATFGPNSDCATPLPPPVTTTCTDNVLTVSRTATVIFDCSPLPTTTVPYTRCPTTKTTWVTTPAACLPGTALTVTECPEATGTVVVTTRYTLPGFCYPTRKTITVTASPTGTDTLPNCTPTSSTGVVLVPQWGQCGGKMWTGSTTCIPGYTCTVLNEWYSQCL